MAANFGRDISCLRSIKTGRFVSGWRLVAEACFRRLITRRGTLPGGEAEADYGLYLPDFVGKALTASLLAAIPGMVKNELEKDARVDDAIVSVVAVTRGPSVAIKLSARIDTADGPFDLQVLASELGVELLRLESAA